MKGSQSPDHCGFSIPTTRCDTTHRMGDLLPTTKTYPVRKWPTFVTVILVFVGWLLNEIALAWIHDRVPRDSPPLPDLFFDIFPEVRGMIRVAEYVMLLLTVNALVIVFCHRHAWHVARRVFFCAALSYTCRSICITLLQVPVPSVHTYCAPKSVGGAGLVAGRVARMFWSAGIEQLRPRELCGDLIVSGHTLTIITSLLTFNKYAPKKMKILSHLYSLLAFIALISILLARKHYTIDVVLGYTVASRVFMEYHSLMAAYHEGTIEKNELWNSLWSRIIPFLERDAPPPHLMTNHLELPFLS